MTVARWPSSLPQYLLATDVQETLPGNLLRSQNDAGPAKVRRRSTATPWEITGQFNMTNTQYTAFRAFVADDIAGGALPFELPSQREASGYWLVRLMVDDVKAGRVGPNWRVAVKFEVLP